MFGLREENVTAEANPGLPRESLAGLHFDRYIPTLCIFEIILFVTDVFCSR